MLTDMTPPHRALLWQLDDIEKAVEQKDIVGVLREKYRDLCRFGMTDSLIFYRALEDL